MTIANAINRSFAERGRTRSMESAIYAVAMDESSVHCLTEDHLNVWWASLRPEEKAELYERHLDGDDFVEALNALKSRVDALATSPVVTARHLVHIAKAPAVQEAEHA